MSCLRHESCFGVHDLRLGEHGVSHEFQPKGVRRAASDASPTAGDRISKHAGRAMGWLLDLIFLPFELVFQALEYGVRGILPVQLSPENLVRSLERIANGEMVIEVTGTSSTIVFEPLPVDDPTQRKPDTSLAQAQLGGWAPTVELTVHIRGVPAPGPLRCSFRSRFVHDGLLDEDGEIWDSTGVLVAQSRQLALIPRPAN